MTYIPATTLEKVWPVLDHAQKASVRGQLDGILANLRSLRRPEGMPLGGVAGEGCKDLRRHVRQSTEPIMDTEGFEKFLFSNPRFGSEIFIKFLRQFSPSCSSRCVFTHGDLRPDNIAAELTEDGQCRITGLLDWECGGFYPEYYESVKCTNCLALDEDSDRYLFAEMYFAIPVSCMVASGSRKGIADGLIDLDPFVN